MREVRNWTLIRRSVQLLVVALLLTPVAGGTFFTGNLSSSQLLGLVLSDPYSVLETTVASRRLLAGLVLSGGIILGLYWVIGGRTYCGWVCPVNILLDWTDWVGRSLRNFRKTVSPVAGATKPDGSKAQGIDGRTPYRVLAVFLLLSAATRLPVFGIINPISAVVRNIQWGVDIGLILVAVLVLWQLIFRDRVWCRYLCPVGTIYGLLGKSSPVRVVLDHRSCTHCGVCQEVCPMGGEPVREVWPRPAALKLTRLTDQDCTNCGLCIDRCPSKALQYQVFKHRQNLQLSKLSAKEG